MTTWRELVENGEYDQAEPAMLSATDHGEGYFPDCEVRASFYENWGDRSVGEERTARLREALKYWEMFASCSTSGGEGTARMRDVHRVAKKLEAK